MVLAALVSLISTLAGSAATKHACRLRAAVAALSMLSLAHCATPTSYSTRGDAEPAQEQTRCRQFYSELDQAVAAAGVADGQSVRISGFPYLRINRLLESYREQVQEDARWRDWLGALRELGNQGTAVEIRNLPRKEYQRLSQLLGALKHQERPVELFVQRCAAHLSEIDFAHEKARRKLTEIARVPRDYSTWKRVVGFYPFTAIGFSRGIRRYQAEMEATYAKPLAELPVTGQLTRYVPAEGNGLKQQGSTKAIEQQRIDPFAIPDPDPYQRDLDALFESFAPDFEIDVAGDDDKIGAVNLPQDGRPTVTVEDPVVYRLASYARLRGQLLLQLNYVIWFPSRPKRSALDLLGGNMDSIIWRVTLDADGAPLVYDSIHSCGCYHMLFPTERARLKPRPPTLEEWAFAPQQAPSLQSGERILLRIASRSHYIERVLATAGESGIQARRYRSADYQELRSLPKPDGTRKSLFAPDGLVIGSERGERFLFWPMGISSAGAMRQWGRHATAFVGMRHFDEPDLIEKAFEIIR